MEDEKYTRNTGRPQEKAEPKAESKTGHAEKLKAEKSSSTASKSKFGKKKSGESQKLKKTGEGKRRIGLKIPIPTPPPPGTKNFHGHEFNETNDVSEEARDVMGFSGVMIGAGIRRKGRSQIHKGNWEHEGSDLIHGREVSADEWANIRGGRGIGKAIESDGTAKPQHKSYYTRFCPHDATHDYSSLKEGKKLSAEQMEEISKNHGFRSTNMVETETATPKHKSYYSRYTGPEHHVADVKKGYSGKIHKGIDELSLDEPEYYEGSNPNSRAYQKRSTQKRIMERASQAKTADSVGNAFQSIGEKIEALIKKISEAAMMFIKDNPAFLIVAAVCSVGVLSATGAVSAFGVLLTGVNNSVVSTSFTAEDDQIKKVEQDFRALEADLSSKMDSVEEDYPGYDEYRYTIAPIKHDPIELAALLTVLYEDYTEDEVKEYLKTIIDGQYDFSVTEVVETRTRMETKWHWVTKTREEERIGFRFENGRLVQYTYTVTVEYQALESYEEEVEYDYYILNVNLTGMSIDSYVQNLGLSEDQLARYKLLKLTKGNKEHLFEDS